MEAIELEEKRKKLEKNKQKETENDIIEALTTDEDKQKKIEKIKKELYKYIKKPDFRDERTLTITAMGLNTMSYPLLSLEVIQSLVYEVLNNYIPPYFVDERGGVIPFKLSQYISNQMGYKHYMNADFTYNGEYYQNVSEKNQIEKIISDEIVKARCNPTTNKINETLKLMRIDNMIYEADKPKKICTNSGLVDIESGVISPYDPKEFTLFKINCNFTSIDDGLNRFEGSRFEQYLKTTFKNDEEVIQNVKEVFGMSLLPNPKKFQRMVLLSGEGNNGKSLLINILKELHGGVISTVPLASIDSKSSGGQNFNIFNMIGKNINIDADASGSRLEGTENLKKITTGDSVQLTKKNEQGASGVLNVLMICAINNLPSSADKSEGFFRRFMLIPFRQHFYKDEAEKKQGSLPVDFNLEDDIIKNEMDIVLAWALEGLAMITINNYQPSYSKSVHDELLSYRKTTDSIFDFIEDNKNGSYVNDIKANHLYDYYVEWCKNNNHEPMKSTGFGRGMKKHYDTKRSNGVIYLNVNTNTRVAKDLGFGFYENMVQKTTMQADQEKLKV